MPQTPLGISELVSKIGDENITVQNLASNLSEVKNGKKDSRLTFFTSPEMGRQIAKEAAGIESSTHIGLILWIPRDKLPTTAAPATPAPAQ